MDFKKKLLNHWPLILASLIFLAITIPAIFQSRHVMMNLEPYPDAILYISRAKHFANTGKLTANYLDSNLRVPIPPLYSFYLSFFFLFTNNPNIFYLANILLGLANLAFLYLIIQKVLNKQKGRNFLIFILLALFLSHGYLLWIPELALIENLGLTLLLLSVYVVFDKKNKVPIWLTVLLTSSWIFAKLNYLPFSAFLFLLFSYKHISKKNWLKLGRYFAGILVMSFIYLGFEAWTGKSHLAFFSNLLTNKVSSPEATNNTAFFSFSYLIPNLKKYSNLLIGGKNNFLWLKFPLSNFLIVFTSMLGIYLGSKNIKTKNLSLTVTGFFLAQFPLLLVFTSSDARYIVLSIPILIICLAILIANIKNLKMSYLILLALLLSQIYLQKDFYKQIISENILGRSSAWQQEAVINFNSQLPNNSFMITALPPFFIDLHQNQNYQALPLSKNQEFINKGQWLWGSAYETNNLLDLYDKLLLAKKQVFISNAYITHNHQVTEDYEKLKDKYDFRLVSRNCDAACEIYEINFKTD
ncbi:MAG: hypothetical protein ABFQ62_03460 [Patescibacteria group bacterium]